MFYSSKAILNSIVTYHREHQLQEHWEGYEPLGVKGREWIVSISNEEQNGRDGMGRIFSFKMDNLSQR